MKLWTTWVSTCATCVHVCWGGRKMTILVREMSSISLSGSPDWLLLSPKHAALDALKRCIERHMQCIHTSIQTSCAAIQQGKRPTKWSLFIPATHIATHLRELSRSSWKAFWEKGYRGQLNIRWIKWEYCTGVILAITCSSTYTTIPSFRVKKETKTRTRKK